MLDNYDTIKPTMLELSLYLSTQERKVKNKLSVILAVASVLTISSATANTNNWSPWGVTITTTIIRFLVVVILMVHLVVALALAHLVAVTECNLLVLTQVQTASAQ